MLTAMIQVDPTVYYAGMNPTLDNTFYQMFQKTPPVHGRDE